MSDFRSWSPAAERPLGRTRRAVLAAGIAATSGLLLPSAARAAADPDIVRPMKADWRAAAYAFQFEVLDTALERGVPLFGPYVQEPYTETMSSGRTQHEAARGVLINVLLSGPGVAALDDGMIRVPVAVDGGTLGNRVSFIRAGDQERLSAIRTIEDLRHFVVGQGAHWAEVPVYRYNHIPLELSSSHATLFAMLSHGRFDLFPRGVSEIQGEFDAYRQRFPGIAIERDLLIQYDYPQFFYVSKQAPHVARRIEYGLRQMLDDGAYKQLFEKHFGARLASLKLEQRTVIRLENPFLPADIRSTQ